MEAKAIARQIRVAPRKARRVVDLIRGKNVQDARVILKFAPQGAAVPVRKVFESAVANARYRAQQENKPFVENAYRISEAFVNEGVTLKRFRPRAQGRAGAIMKRTSHITVVISSQEKEGGR